MNKDTEVLVGEDINIKKALHFTGVNFQTGLPEYEDVNHDGSITTPEDYVIVGKTSPFFYGGFGSNLSYKQFEIDIFDMAAHGFQVDKQVSGNSTAAFAIRYLFQNLGFAFG